MGWAQCDQSSGSSRPGPFDGLTAVIWHFWRTDWPSWHDYYSDDFEFGKVIKKWIPPEYLRDGIKPLIFYYSYLWFLYLAVTYICLFQIDEERYNGAAKMLLKPWLNSEREESQQKKINGIISQSRCLAAAKHAENTKKNKKKSAL